MFRVAFVPRGKRCLEAASWGRGRRLRLGTLPSVAKQVSEQSNLTGSFRRGLAYLGPSFPTRLDVDLNDLLSLCRFPSRVQDLSRDLQLFSNALVQVFKGKWDRFDNLVANRTSKRVSVGCNNDQASKTHSALLDLGAPPNPPGNPPGIPPGRPRCRPPPPNPPIKSSSSISMGEPPNPPPPNPPPPPNGDLPPNIASKIFCASVGVKPPRPPPPPPRPPGPVVNVNPPPGKPPGKPPGN
jgi:hypothetical protein